MPSRKDYKRSYPWISFYYHLKKRLLFSLIIIGKVIFYSSRFMRLGSGTTWPGYFILALYPRFFFLFFEHVKAKVILVTGTNGKTTTTKLIHTILKTNHCSVISNISGANLLSGIASCLIHCTSLKRLALAEYIVLEIDEQALPIFISVVKPDYLIVLNLFRDQLDRHGEINALTAKWQHSFLSLPHTTKLFLNADDPSVSFLAKYTSAIVHYFGLPKANPIKNRDEEMADCTHSPCCDAKVIYEKRICAHLGIWSCSKCGIQRPNTKEYKIASSIPDYSLFQYNLQAACLVAEQLGIPYQQIEHGIAQYQPAFGRSVHFHLAQKNLVILLSKNPVSMRESLRTVLQMQGKNLWLLLNNFPCDGQDTSWIWDINFEQLTNVKSIILSGNKAEDLKLCLSYALFTQTKRPSIHIEKNLKKAFKTAIQFPDPTPLFILPNYSALLDLRKLFHKRDLIWN